jgi:hypothetical protein
VADKKKNGGMLQPTPYNEAPGDPDSPNISGGGIYGTYEEVISAQLSSQDADLMTTPNMEASEAIMGQTAPDEPEAMKPGITRNSQR